MEAPSVHLQMSEAWWPLEAFVSSCLPLPSCLLPKGEKQPVLVLPAFTADDASTLSLRHVLRRHGHWVHAWRLGNNVGPTPRAVAGMRSRVWRLSQHHGRPIALVGWSLGGIYARMLARDLPECVSQVITLGSPFRAQDRDRSAVQGLWDQVKHLHGDEYILDANEESRPALKVPATSIFTKSDGVVRWELCVDDVSGLTGDRQAENIEVFATHSGLGLNSSVAYAVLDRVAQPVGEWQPFVPPRLIDWWYPRGAASTMRDFSFRAA